MCLLCDAVFLYHNVCLVKITRGLSQCVCRRTECGVCSALREAGGAPGAAGAQGPGAQGAGSLPRRPSSALYVHRSALYVDVVRNVSCARPYVTLCSYFTDMTTIIWVYNKFALYYFGSI